MSSDNHNDDHCHQQHHNNNNNNNNNTETNIDKDSGVVNIDIENESFLKRRIRKYLEENPQPKYVNVPLFVHNDIPLSTFFMTAGALTSVGFFIGVLLGARKNGGIRNTMRSAPPGVIALSLKALAAGSALSIGSTAFLVYGLKTYYNVNTVNEFGDLMSSKVLGMGLSKKIEWEQLPESPLAPGQLQKDNNIDDEDIKDAIQAIWKPENDMSAKRTKNINNNSNNNSTQSKDNNQDQVD
ncbi:hypothetical protein SAMD00019534_052290 [Acytostelium subglobosum LB1]|uniref:hypothetical protein n=1 Tax=Acytostelium subglobosum LB1 TaxID=1410327 RepID=UPI000644B317|nr:hypothetical protein SAMD00019534_052290 [Acytostelium subglobosum LB1]GAM22054.1 hypothetical protein SAMD00019534_052290 [Acytostelium subglobosum LB1]|eukprot:XP_012755154.1 hypothetical protein SAMD00019534_052290 [Acytostelium subglobosum LB1]